MLAVAGVAATAQTPSPRNQVAMAANEFHGQYVNWAEAWNRMSAGTIDAKDEPQAFGPLGRLWKRVESLRARWLLG